MDNFCGSTFWNTSLTWHTSYPNFTSCFEKTILLWIPCVFLWMMASVETYFLLNSNKTTIPNSFVNISKFTVISGLVILVIIDIISLNNWSTVVQEVDLYSPIIKGTTLVLAGVLTFYNKKTGMQTSGILFIFWLLMGICGIPQFHSEIKNISRIVLEESSSYSYFQGIINLISYPLVVLMFFLNCMADKLPTDSNYFPPKKPCPEETASFLSRQFFSWFDSFALQGLRKPIESTDLWDLNEHNSSRHIFPIFETHLNTLSKRKRKKKGASFLPALFKSFGVLFIFGTMYKVAQDLLTFVSPQILSLFITFISKKQETWKGILYALSLFIVAMIQTVVSQQYLNKMLIIGMRIRSVLIAAIYRKSLRTSSAARKEISSGEIVNLMAVDAQRFMDLIVTVNVIWSAPLQIVLAFYFLWQELGPSVITGLVIMIIVIPINGYIAHHSKILQTQQMKFKDDRIKRVNEILNGIKVLKLYGWESSFEDQVVRVRNMEIGVLKQSAYLSASTSFILSCTPFLVSLVTFATYVLLDSANVLDANKAFVSISLFNIIRVPLNQLPQLISSLVQAHVSVKRINTFLNSEELDPNNVSHHVNKEYPAVIKNGTFSWDQDEILKNINLSLKNGNLTALIGTYGSGKSSVLSALLGEMRKESGTVNTFGNIALVAQQAWIQNATLRANILFGKSFHQEFYNEVIEACSLKPDLELLPGGDLTEIGERGINLSGGQKQRVSLARAIYAEADIYLLDDPLSAVDSHVGKHIFDKVIGPNGLLKCKTRLLVTHGVTFLSQTNHILVMKDGEISESGNYEELMEKKGAFSEFITHYINEGITENPENQLVQSVATDANTPFSKRPSGDANSKALESDSNKNSKINAISKNHNKFFEKRSRNKDLIEKEKAETGNVRWTVYKHYMECIGYPLIFSTLMMFFMYQSFSIGSNIWLGLWADDNEVYQNDTGKRDMYLAVYGALGFAQVITVIVANLSFTKATLEAAIKLHSFLLSNIMRTPMAFFDVTPIGRILARFSSDINNVDTTLPSQLQGVLSTSVQVIGTLVVISYTTPWFLTVTIPVFLGYYAILRVCVAITRQVKRIESVSRSPIYSHFSETITGVQTIRAYSELERFSLESEEKVDVNQKCYYCGIKAFRWMAVRLEFMGNIIVFFTALFAVFSKAPTAGLVGLSITYAIEITQILKAFIRVIANVETSIVAVERIKEYEEEPREAPWVLSNERIEKTWPVNGEIVFSCYSVRYRPGLDLALKNLNFTLTSREKVGIVGRTGAGKSSLTLSLFRILEAAEGKIIIDDVNIADIGLQNLRSRLTIIPQEPVLFAGTLRINLDPFQRHTDHDVWKSLEHAHLKDFVKGLPAGLQHEVVEGGKNLSVGQRQLICLARALLRKTKVLILDEATAAIDLETDELIQETIRTEFKECTVLTIAHRLNTILDYDRIMVLDKAEMVEFDTPEKLTQNHKSIFYGMCKDAGLL